MNVIKRCLNPSDFARKRRRKTSENHEMKSEEKKKRLIIHTIIRAMLSKTILWRETIGSKEKWKIHRHAEPILSFTPRGSHSEGFRRTAKQDRPRRSHVHAHVMAITRELFVCRRKLDTSYGNRLTRLFTTSAMIIPARHGVHVRTHRQKETEETLRNGFWRSSGGRERHHIPY